MIDKAVRHHLAHVLMHFNVCNIPLRGPRLAVVLSIMIRDEWLIASIHASSNAISDWSIVQTFSGRKTCWNFFFSVVGTDMWRWQSMNPNGYQQSWCNFPGRAGIKKKKAIWSTHLRSDSLKETNKNSVLLSKRGLYTSRIPFTSSRWPSFIAQLLRIYFYTIIR